jgi:2-phosphosulfolactate phosphatase
VKVNVGFTPAEQVSGELGIAIDVLRATSTMCQAFASGWKRVVCVAEVEDAHALAADGVALAGERHNVLIEGFDFGNSPREFLEPPARSTLVMTTTNGTRLLLAAAARCETVLVASLLNLRAVVEAARASGAGSVAVLCAGVEGAFAIDDAYVAGRIVRDLGGDPDDAAVAAVQLAGSFATAEEGIGGGSSAENIRNANLDDDIAWCARESILDVVPRVVARREGAVELALV